MPGILMPMTPDERARRAVIRAVDDLTELVSITLDDPNDQNPDPAAFVAEPTNLFDLAFKRVGIDNDALLEGFRTRLRLFLPKIRSKIEQMPLSPGVSIGVVWNYLKRELEKANM